MAERAPGNVSVSKCVAKAVAGLYTTAAWYRLMTRLTETFIWEDAVWDAVVLPVTVPASQGRERSMLHAGVSSSEFRPLLITSIRNSSNLSCPKVA